MTGKSFPVVLPLALAVGAVVIVVRRRRWSGRRHGEATTVEQTMQCKCGKVRATVALREKERGNVPSAFCYCNDCIGFVEWVNEQAVQAGAPPSNIIDETGATTACNILKDCVRLDSGGEHICFIKLRKDARLKRFYADCCFTPLGFTLDAPWYPSYGIYIKVLSDAAFLGAPKSRLNMSGCKNRDLLPLEKKDKEEEWSEGLSAAFVLFMLRRIIGGVLFGRGTPDDLMALPQASAPKVLASAS